MAPSGAQSPNGNQIKASPAHDHVQYFVGPVTSWNSVGPVFNVINKGPHPGYGIRLDYYSEVNRIGIRLGSGGHCHRARVNAKPNELSRTLVRTGEPT